MRVLACGGRDYSNAKFVFDRLGEIHRDTPITCLIHGGQTGADLISDDWAESVGINTMPFPVSKEEWRRLGRSAGPIRNRTMLEEGRPDLVVAFPGGIGTRNMIRQAAEYGVEVRTCFE